MESEQELIAFLEAINNNIRAFLNDPQKTLTEARLILIRSQGKLIQEAAGELLEAHAEACE